MERRGVAKEITLVSGSPAALLAMIMACGEGKRLYRGQVVEVEKPRSGGKEKKRKRTDAQFKTRNDDMAA